MSPHSVMGCYVFLLTLLNTQVGAIKWLAVSQVSAVASSSRDPGVCDQMKGSLIKKQVKFCKRNPGFMDSVRLGAVRAIDECQYQFRQRRWNCSSLQDNVNSQINLIKAHLGSKMTDSDLSGLKLTGLPSLPSSSLYSQQSLMGGGPPQHGLYDPEPTINAMFNSYTFKEKPRRSRNVRRRDRGRSRKARRNLDTQLMDMQSLASPDTNVTKTDITKNNKPKQEQTHGHEGESEEDPARG